jgi:hypothetical protein
LAENCDFDKLRTEHKGSFFIAICLMPLSIAV